MTERLSQSTLENPASADVLPEVVLELRQAAGRSATFPISHVDFLIGTVPGCDLRVPGSELPAVLCLLARRPGGLALRKLAPTQMILVNGKAVTHAELRDSDRISLGATDIFVRLTAGSVPRAAEVSRPAEIWDDRPKNLAQLTQFEERLAQFQSEQEAFREEQRLQCAELQKAETLLREREEKLQGQTAAFDKDRAFWLQRPHVPDPSPESTPQNLRLREEQLSLREVELQDQLADIQRQRQELANVRQELADIRKQLYDRYQERRDRLAGLQEAVDKAARKVQERKRLVDAEDENLQQRGSQLEEQAAQLETETRRLDDARRRSFQEKHDRTQRESTDRANDLQAREHRLAADRLELEGMVKHYQAGMLRLDRQTADLEERDRKVKAGNEELERRHTQLERSSRELEQQAGELEQWREKLTREADGLAQVKIEQETAADQLTQRESSLEAQQATLAALRTRLERQRDDLRSQEQHLEEQRLRQEKAEVEIEKQFQESLRVRAELDAERKQRDQERHEIIQRQTVLDAGEHQLRQAQERMARQDADLQYRTQELEQRLAEMADEERDLRERQAQLAQAEVRLEADQTTLQQGLDQVANEQQACADLREKQRIRGDELDAQQKSIREQIERCSADGATLKKNQEEWKLYHQEAMDQLCVRKQQLEEKDQALAEQGRQLEQQQEELLKREEVQRRQLEQLREASQTVAEQRQRLAQDREKFLAEQQQIRQEHEQTQALFVEMRLQAESFVEQLPEIELQAGTTMDRLTQAREQLRDHLSEISAYVRQCQEDMEKDSRQIQEKEKTLRQHQDEHRLALVSFRQQLVEWQTQMPESRRAAGDAAPERQHTPSIEQRQPEPSMQPRLAQDTRPRLTPRKAADPPRPVEPRPDAAPRSGGLSPPARPAEPRPSASQGDVQQWYRKKFRDLTGTDAEVKPAAAASTAAQKPVSEADDGDAPLIPIRRDILTLTDPADPGDRQLGDALRRLEFVDADTLQALLVETRRQRRPLRQVLLAGGVLTVYQLTLIETGNVDGLVMGPLRIIDRLRVSAQESVYRVFDPRRGQEALLRHLGEEPMRITGRADEFRQGFTRAILGHPHLAETLEVLEIAGRPAVLQEWLTGLPSTDWPPLVSVPGVCYRLLIQAVQGLDAIHTAGLVHGHLRENRILLMPDGIIKLCGMGEPAWFTDDEPNGQPSPQTPAGDLLALGQIVSKWCTPLGIRRGAKTKPPPDALVSLVMRLAGEENAGFANSVQVLGALELIRKDVPANPEAWDRLLRHVKDHVVPNPLAA